MLQSLEENALPADTSLRERAWMCNILTRRYRLDGRLDEAVSAAREAIEIGRKLKDQYVVALNRIGLGNALRQKGNLDEALSEFQQSGKEAQEIHRTEIDGLASRLASSVLLEKADDSAPYLRPALYSQAETFATYVIGLLSGSIAEQQAAQAYDCRGDARWGLGQKGDARFDWAAAARLELALDPDDALTQLNNLSRNLDLEKAPIEAMQVMLSTVPQGSSPASRDPWRIMIAMLGQGIEQGHIRAAGVYTLVALKIMQQRVPETLEFGLWLRILQMTINEHDAPDDGRMSFVLAAFLAHSRVRNLTVTQISALVDLTLGQSEHVHFHSVDGHLQVTLKLGAGDRVLLVLNDFDTTPATRFAMTALVSFFVGFRKEIDREFLTPVPDNAPYIRCSFMDFSEAPADIKEIVSVGEERAVAIAASRRTAQEPHDIFVVCKPDLQERCQGDMLKGTELQILYGEILRALLAVAYGGEIESEVLRPKLVRLVRQTI